MNNGGTFFRLGFHRLKTLLQASVNYGNPAQMLWQRLRRRSLEEFCVVDRRSGVACRCRPDAHRMFGEIWFDRDYDVPGILLQRNDVVVDVGGNQGFFACYAASHGCRVVTFEPDADNVRLLRLNIAANGFSAQTTIVAAAVTSSGRDVRLFRTDCLGGGMNTTVARFAEKMGFANGDSVVVPSVKLADVLQNEKIDHVRLCKMDCEGAELEIIESLSAELARRIDAFALEFHREAYPLEKLIRALDRWGTHHVFPAPDKYCPRNIIYAISKDALGRMQ